MLWGEFYFVATHDESSACILGVWASVCVARRVGGKVVVEVFVDARCAWQGDSARVRVPFCAKVCENVCGDAW